MKWKVPKIWKGECWIIGGGSSVAEQFNIPDTLIPESKEEFRAFGDYLTYIHKKRCIGVNVSAFLGDWVDVAYWGDSDTYTDYRAWFDQYAGLKISSAGKFSDASFKEIKHLYKSLSGGLTKRKNQVSWVCKNSGASAIDLAHKLGATVIYVLGIDMYLHPEKRIHWHKGYPDKTKTPTMKQLKQGKKHPRRIVSKKSQENLFKKQLQGWSRIAKDCEAKGIKVINVNPKSRVDVFPKMSLKEIIESDEEV